MAQKDLTATKQWLNEKTKDADDDRTVCGLRASLKPSSPMYNGIIGEARHTYYGGENQQVNKAQKPAVPLRSVFQKGSFV